MKTIITTLITLSLLIGTTQAALIDSSGFTASASTEISTSRAPDKAIDGSDVFLTGGGDADTPGDWRSLGDGSFGIDDTWLSANHGGNPGDEWFAVELGGTFAVDDFNFFNFGAQASNNADRGVNQADVYYRVGGGLGNNSNGNGTAFDTTGWTLLGTLGTQTFALGPDGVTPQGPDTLTFGGVTVSAIALDVNTNHGDGGFVGINEVQVFGTAVVLNPEWIFNGSGSWGTDTNWSTGSAPDGLSTIFGTTPTSPATVTLDQNRSVENLTFDNSNSYTLTANTLTVGGDVSTNQGSHTIASNVDLTPGMRTLTSASGASLNITGTTTMTNDGGGTIVLDGAGGGSIGAIRDNNDVSNILDGTDNINVVKRGTGTWTIGTGGTTLEDFHGGSTTVEAGTLKINGAGSDGELRSPTIRVNAGARLDTSEFGQYTLQVDQRLEGEGTVDTGSGDLRVSGAATVAPGDNGTGTLSVTGDLTLAGGLGGSQGALIFELSETSGGANDQISVTGDLVSNAGTGDTNVSIIPTGTSLASSYELITFGGTYTGNGAADFAIDASLQTRFTQSISVDSDSVNLNITGSNANIAWRGNVDDNWDVNSTSNWDNGGSDVFFDLDSVTFDDTLTGTGTVSIAANVTPASTTINNSSQDYTFAGAGAIAGSGSVTKSGGGRATIQTANSYTGTTTISGGTLHAANNDALGTTDGGTIADGGTLDITGTNIGDEVVTINGAGEGGRGALITDGLDSLGGGARQLTHVIQSGPATIGAYSDQPANSIFEANDYRWDLEPATNFPNTNASWQGNGHAVTKKGRGTASIQRVGDMGGGDINIEQGVLLWQGSTTSAGATVTIGDNVNPYKDADVEETGLASLSTFYSTATGPAPTGGIHAIDLVLQGGALNHEGFGGIQDVSVTGTVTNNDVTGDSTIDNQIASSSSRLTITNGITGDGDLRFAGEGDGIVELQGNNTYTGRTEVTGNLALAGNGQLSGTPVIELHSSIDATARTDGTLVLSGQTLKVGGDATANVGLVTIAVNPVQDSRMRFNPSNPDIDNPETNPAQLFVGPLSTTDVGRSVLEFDLSSVPALAGVTDISSVTFDAHHSSDGSSSGNAVNVEVYELTQDFVEGETSGKEASTGVLWTGYTLDGDADPNAAGFGAAGALVSVASSNASMTETVQFTDNQGGAFETLIENALAGSGSVKLLMKNSDASEASGTRDLNRFSERTSANPPALNIEFDGVSVEGITEVSIVGDLDMDASSTLELDVYNDTFTDLLDISGTADLDGTLDINLLSGSPLVVNDMVTVLSAAGGITDSGLSVTGPFTHSIVGNDLVLTFTGGIPGDADGDGDVDGADFLLLQRNNPAGISTWQANYGNPLAASIASSAVPEPSTVGLCILGIALGGGLLRKLS